MNRARMAHPRAGPPTHDPPTHGPRPAPRPAPRRVRCGRVLTGGRLVTYAAQEVAKSKMLGVIDLRQCQVIADTDSQTKKAFSFGIDTPQRRWLLVADSKDERNEWVTVLTFHPEYRSA